MKMVNYTTLYKAKLRDRKQNEEKNKWAKERGKDEEENERWERLRMKGDKGKAM